MLERAEASVGMCTIIAIMQIMKVAVCMQVAKVLVLLHNELLHGVTNRMDSLRQAAAAQASASMREMVSQKPSCDEHDPS